MGVGMPATLLLHQFGRVVGDAFGDLPFHVGSSVDGKQWRDVDVRLILDDDQYAAMGLGEPNTPYNNPKWCALCLAFSALGQQMTGLPIDFQIQQQSRANAEYGDRCRATIGIFPIRAGDGV